MSTQVYIKRKENNLKQIDVARMLSIHKQSYYMKEKGKRDFTITEAKRLARIYRCTLDELFN